MARHGGAYRSDKRQKELARLKKQEEKRQRRFGNLPPRESATEEPATEENKEDSQ